MANITTEQGPIERIVRAAYAYIHTGPQRMPDLASCAVVDLDGLSYTILRDAKQQALAVYRIGNNGALRRLKRPPEALLSPSALGVLDDLTSRLERAADALGERITVGL